MAVLGAQLLGEALLAAEDGWSGSFGGTRYTPLPRGRLLDVGEAEVDGPIDFRRHLCSQRAARTVLDRYVSAARAEGHVTIPGAEMRRLLHAFGATEADLEQVSALFDHLNPDPALPSFKKNLNGRVAVVKPEDGAAFKRYGVKQVPFVLHAEDMQTSFTSMVRHYPPLPRWWTSNTAVRAYQVIVFHFLDPAGRPAAGIDGCSSTYVVDQFPTRICRGPVTFGEPTPEGVHQDGIELAMVSLFRRENVRESTGCSRLWSLEQPPGKIDEDLEGWDRHLIHQRCMSDRFDTQFLYDRRVKHDVTPFELRDPHKCAHRDVLVMFARRPKLDGTDKHHEELWND